MKSFPLSVSLMNDAHWFVLFYILCLLMIHQTDVSENRFPYATIVFPSIPVLSL